MTDVKELRDLIERLRTLSRANNMLNGEVRTSDTLRQAASALQSLVDRNGELETALKTLGKACANYRHMHDRFGGGDIMTGRAWDEMRRAEEAALKTFAARSALPPEAQS